MSKLVSICVPTYNGAEFIEKCLKSIISQSYAELEIIIIDDCSQDNTLEIIRDYALKDKRISVIQNITNLGLVGNWNRCFEFSHGEWIKYAFQDDILDSSCIERMTQENKKGTAIVACRRRFIFSNEGKNKGFKEYVNAYNMEKVFHGDTDISQEKFKKAVLDYPFKNFIGEPTSILLKRDVFRRFGFFNPHIIQLCDIEYWVRVGIHTGLKYIPEELVQFRIHDSGTTKENLNKHSYRWQILDMLICYHEFLFNPTYEPLRRYAAQQNVLQHFQEQFFEKVNEALSIAQKNENTPLGRSHESCLAEFNEITGNFPAINLFIAHPFMVKWRLAKKKYRNLIKRTRNRIVP